MRAVTLPGGAMFAKPERSRLHLHVRDVTVVVLLWTIMLLSVVHYLRMHHQMVYEVSTSSRISFYREAAPPHDPSSTSAQLNTPMGPDSIPDGSTVMFSYTNKGYADWMLNWVAHGRNVGAHMVVVALDQHVEQLCINHSIPHLVPDSAAQLAGESFRADRAGKFRAMGHLKGKLAAALLTTYNFSAVIISDTDVAWLRNPAELLALQPEADILISTDCLSTKLEAAGYVNTNRCGHVPGSHYNAAYNTGVVIARNTQNAVQLLREWSARLANDKVTEGKWIMTDQLVLNSLFKEGTYKVASIDPAQGSRVLWLWKERVRVAPLPGLVVASGHAAFVQHLHKRYSTAPYAIHGTFQLKGAQRGKLMRFKEAGLWLVDPPEYFSNGSYLTYVNLVSQYVEAVAAEWAQAAGQAMTQLHKHLVGMAFQRQVLADALAVGAVLNRTVVPPPFLCWCDQDWVADILSSCSILGADTDLPYRCMSDFLMYTDEPVEQYLRFPGFLEDARVPSTIKASRGRLLMVDSAPAAAVLRTNMSYAVGVVQRYATDADITAAVAAMLPARVLSLGPLVPGAIGAITNISTRHLVTQRQQRVGLWQNWCCASKEWDQQQFEYAVFYYGDPTTADKTAAAAAAAGGSITRTPWTPPAKLFQRPGWCESPKLLEVNRKYATYPQHPCSYLQQWTAPASWQQQLEGIAADLSKHMADLWQDPTVLPQV